VSVVWFLEARAYLPWARDPRAGETFEVVPGQPGQPILAGPGSPRRWISPRGLAVLGLLAVAVAWPYLDTDVRTYAVLCGACLVSIVGSIALLVWVCGRRQRALARNLGDVEVEIARSPVRPGDGISYRLRLCPNEPIHIALACVEFRGYEQATYERIYQTSQDGGTATETHTFTRLLHHEQTTPAREREVRMHETVVLQGSFRVPETAPATLRGRWNRVAWEFQVNLWLAEGLVWSKTVEATVCP
jgi:hypothetical protein